MIRGLDQMEAAILNTKLSVVMAMLNYGNANEQRFAREEIQRLSNIVKQHVDPKAFTIAAHNLGFTEEEMRLLEQTGI